MKERIFHFVTTIPEKRLKAGCWVFYILALFAAVFSVNAVFFLRASPLRTLVISAVEFVILLFTFTLFGLIPKALAPLVGRVGFLYHSGTHELVIKPEVHRAQALAHRRDWSGAIKEYRKLFAQFPDRLDFLFEIGEIYRKEIGDNERAVTAYRRVAQHPETGEFAYLVRQARHRIEELSGKAHKHPDVIEVE